VAASTLIHSILLRRIENTDSFKQCWRFQEVQFFQSVVSDSCSTGEHVVRCRAEQMEITEIRMTLTDGPKLKAFATITLDDCFVVRGLKIIQGQHSTDAPCCRSSWGLLLSVDLVVDQHTKSVC